MATTPNYGWVMPDPTDFVTDLPADFEIFGDAADASVKALNPGTTAGDLDYYTTSTAKARLGIGTAGQILAVNSGETAPEWVAPPGDVSPVELSITGLNYYIRNYPEIDFTGSTSVTEDKTHYYPVFLPTCTLNQIGMRSGSTAATSSIRLGIYNLAADNRPGTLLLDAGTVNANTTTTFFNITISQAIDEGWYYLAINRQSGTTHFTTGNMTTPPVRKIKSFTSQATGIATITQFSETGVTGAFANAGTLSADTNTSDIFPIWVRVA